MTGSKPVQIGQRNRAILDGEEDLSQWDDEELANGRRRDRNGKFTGALPKVVPYALYQELNRRASSAARIRLLRAVHDAADYLADVAAGIVEPNRTRAHVAESLVNRVLGKEPLRVEISEGPMTPWERVLAMSHFRTVMLDVDGEQRQVQVNALGEIRDERGQTMGALQPAGADDPLVDVRKQEIDEKLHDLRSAEEQAQQWERSLKGGRSSHRNPYADHINELRQDLIILGVDMSNVDAWPEDEQDQDDYSKDTLLRATAIDAEEATEPEPMDLEPEPVRTGLLGRKRRTVFRQADGSIKTKGRR